MSFPSRLIAGPVMAVSVIMTRPGGLRAQCNDANAYQLKWAVGSHPSVAPSGIDVILIHGYVLGDTCENAISRDPGLTYFHTFDLNPDGSTADGAKWTDLVRKMNRLGVRVWTYNWPTYLSIAKAGDTLGLKVRSAQGIAPRLILVGHSMGGLVAMQALTGPLALRGTVVRVITLGTPHRGTPAGYFDLSSKSTQEVRDPAFLNGLISQRRPEDGALTFALGGRITPDPALEATVCSLEYRLGAFAASEGDCVVPTKSAYDDYDSSSTALRLVTPSGVSSYRQSSGYYPDFSGILDIHGYDHRQLALDYTNGSPGDRSHGQDLYCKVRELLGLISQAPVPHIIGRGDIKQTQGASDCTVDVVDLGVLLSTWSRTDKPPADLNQDGVVNIVDLGILLSGWGVDTLGSR